MKQVGPRTEANTRRAPATPLIQAAKLAFLFGSLVTLLFALSLEAQQALSNAELIASPEPGWPQWRGPRRDGICAEKGLLQSWPERGPRLLWKISELGNGYSAPIIARGRMYLAGDVGENLAIFARDLSGRPLWTATNGASWKTPYPGARASCTFANGRIVHMNANARVGCYDAESGQERWAVDLRERFGSRKIMWATSECLLVDGSKVIVTTGGIKALMAALDLNSGATVWTTPPLALGPSPSATQQRASEPVGEYDPPSYASPILLSIDGHRHIVSCSRQHVFAVDAASGQLQWSRPLRTRHQVVAMTPVLVGDSIFVTAPHTDDAGLYRLRHSAKGFHVEKAWSTRLDTCHGGVVLVRDALYGSRYDTRGWACVDPRTGTFRYDTKLLAKGSVLYADNRLYVLSEEGEMALLRPTESAFEFEGRFLLVTQRKNDVWTHPVIHDGRLYLRYHGELWCYDISDKPVTAK